MANGFILWTYEASRREHTGTKYPTNNEVWPTKGAFPEGPKRSEGAAGGRYFEVPYGLRWCSALRRYASKALPFGSLLIALSTARVRASRTLGMLWSFTRWVYFLPIVMMVIFSYEGSFNTTLVTIPRSC